MHTGKYCQLSAFIVNVSFWKPVRLLRGNIRNMSNNERPRGLDESTINILVGLIFLVLLLWGPIEPFGIVIRIAYLIILPVLFWLALSYFGRRWDGDKTANERLSRGLAGVLAGVFLIGAILSFTTTRHTECNTTITTYDGYDCVGDYTNVSGPDIGQAALLLGASGLTLWYAVAKRDEK